MEPPFFRWTWLCQECEYSIVYYGGPAVNLEFGGFCQTVDSMDWFKEKNTGKPHIYWENLWFPVDFPLNQSIDWWSSHMIDDRDGTSSP